MNRSKFFYKRIFLQLIALGLFFFLLAGRSPVVYGQEGDSSIPNIPKLDVVVIVDESASMWETTDLDRKRIDAFNLLIDSLGGLERSSENVRVSVIAFGSAELTQVVVPFTPVNSQTVNDIKEAYFFFNERLAYPADGAVVGLRWTDALYALELAEAQFTDATNGHRPEYKPAIIIMSDGKPETQQINDKAGDSDFESKLESYINQILAQAAKFSSEPGELYYYEGPCEPPLKKGWVPIYTVAVNDGAILPTNYQEIWRKLAEQNGGSYYAEPGHLTPQNLGSVYFEIYRDLICQESRLEPIAVPSVNEYQVEELYSNIVFTILKGNEGIQVRLYRPDGSQLSESDPNVIVNKSRLDEVWSIKRGGSWAGTWKVELTGEGRILFSYDTFSDIQINTISPTSDFSKAGKPIDISVEVINSDGTPLTSSVQSFTLDVIRPSGETTPLGNLTATGERFNYSFEDTLTEGEYYFEGQMTMNQPSGGGTIQQPWSLRMVSVLDPYLSMVSPPENITLYTSEPLDLQVDIKVADQPAVALASQNPPVTALLFKDGIQVYEPVTLVFAGELAPARMRGQIPPNTLQEGEYTIQYTLEAQGIKAEQEIIRTNFIMQPATVATTATPAPVPTATPAPVPTVVPEPPEPLPLGFILAMLLVLLLVAIVVLAVVWYMQSPKMQPFTLRSYGDGTMETYGQRLGGKLSQNKRFFTKTGEEIKLQFSPAQDVDGNQATKVTLMNNPADPAAFVEVDGQRLFGKGESALITKESDWLTIDGEHYEIQTW